MQRHIKLTEIRITTLGCILSGIILYVDHLTPIGVNTPLLYLIVIFLALLSDRLKPVVFFAVLTSVLTTVGIFYSVDSGDWSTGIVNRMLVIVGIWTIVIVGIKFKQTQRQVWILASMVESAADSIIAKDLSGRVIYWNKGAERLYGYTADEMRGRSIKTVFPEYLKSQFPEILGRLRKDETITNLETVREHKDGRLIHVALNLSPIRTLGGKIIGASTISRDITEQVEQEERKNRKLRELQDQIHSKSVESRALEEKIYDSTRELSEQRERLDKLMDSARKYEQRLRHSEQSNEDLEGQIADQTRQLDEHNRQLELEIIEQAQIENDLRDSQQRLKTLGAHMTTIREQERATMAREIHDELGQLLTAIKMDVSWFESHAGQDADDKFKKRIEETRQLIDNTISSVQRLVAQLRPSILDDLGVLEAINWQAKEFEKRSGVRCMIDIDRDHIDLPGEVGTALFRIFQECLTNIARHAEATRADISVSCLEDHIMLKVHDNGIGIAEANLKASNSFGLMGMKERAEMFGGTIQIQGIQGRGTQVKVTLPLNREKG